MTKIEELNVKIGLTNEIIEYIDEVTKDSSEKVLSRDNFILFLDGLCEVKNTLSYDYQNFKCLK